MVPLVVVHAYTILVPPVDRLPFNVTLVQEMVGGGVMIESTAGEPGFTPSQKLPTLGLPPAAETEINRSWKGPLTAGV
jgi:hypothetical protein